MADADVKKIEIEIDGKLLTATPEQTVMQVADAAGIYIPRFCYHKHLSIAANCRMCLVEVEKSPKTLPACATPVMPGMKVFTKSQKTIESQRVVMEFLLINHPLDCPICDQGGECELQDLSMGYGSSHSHYDECKRSVPDQDFGPLIATEMTRCIYCTRCVRFGAEIAGFRELGLIGRGEDTEVSTYVQHAIHSEVSGNIIDLCPVGALTSKPYRFTARPWELNQAPSVGAHDCLGTNIFVHSRYGKVMRVVSRENMSINETWIADRDRYSYTGLYHPDRIGEPLAKINGEWQVVTWQKALEIATGGLQKVLSESSSDELGALASPNSTLEEFYLLQKLVTALGSKNIDHRLRASDPVTISGYNPSLSEFEKSDAILLIGSNLPKEQPLAALRVRKAIKHGAVVAAINAVDYLFNFVVDAKKITTPANFAAAIAGLTTEDADANISAIRKLLQDKKQISIVVGAEVLHHPEASALCYLVQQLAENVGAKIYFMTDGANATGATLVKTISGKIAGMNAYQMLEKPRQAYLLLNVEPELDCANAALTVAAMQQAKFIVALSMYHNPVLSAHADVILPICAFTETSGTYVNAMGDWQSFTGVANAFESSRPAWKVLRVLGNFLQLEGFEYDSSETVKHEVQGFTQKMTFARENFKRPANLSLDAKATLYRIGEIPIYAVDSLVRRAEPLQRTQMIMEGDAECVRIHPKTAQELNLQEGGEVQVRQKDAEATLRVKIDERIAEKSLWVAGGVMATSTLGNLYGEIEIR